MDTFLVGDAGEERANIWRRTETSGAQIQGCRNLQLVGTALHQGRILVEQRNNVGPLDIFYSENTDKKV